MIQLPLHLPFALLRFMAPAISGFGFGARRGAALATWGRRPGADP
jgi:hypothetical protein